MVFEHNLLTYREKWVMRGKERDWTTGWIGKEGRVLVLWRNTIPRVTELILVWRTGWIREDK